MDCEKRLKKLIAILLAVASVFVGVPAHAVETKDGEGIYIVTGSEINLVARSSNIPIQIKNTFASDVVVHVHVRPTNARVSVPIAVAVKVPGETTVTAKIPVNAVANGKVLLRAWIETFSGLQIGKAVVLSMNVNADIELAMLLGFGGAVVLLLAIGIVRTVRKNRKLHEQQMREDSAVDLGMKI
ncbi:hypothetical protein Rhola_00013950 [Rhodoluna lacicola]|uniref:Uncharacterized protein n=1 Tax=Rhodoluna lacicola TaxID=529884 RepID=A0A060JPW5_9MICO|nr:DUF6049 family protein [Rhodoluna lacicola]AIC48184.1 hypothetical protein Rhola_00013950 [Rhodoluna lacicola]BDS51101.1 hypothetical protein RKACHI23_13630 [Rhodoluna lacicola]